MKFYRISSIFVLVAAVGVLPGCDSDGAPYPPSPRRQDFPQGIERGPQLALPSERSMTIAWRSLVPVLGSVDYWAADGGAVLTVSGTGISTEHVILLDGLEPATTYLYRVRSGPDALSELSSFKSVSDDPSAAIRFAVLGDHGCGCDTQYAVLDVIRGSTPDLVLTTGDNAYYDGTRAEVLQNYFAPMASLIDQVPVYPCLGNHDVRTEYARPLLEQVYLPANNADGSEHFYSFQRGNCLFIALDSNQDLSSASLQYEWLEDELQSNTSDWVICYFHHPMYSDSSHGDAPLLQFYLAPLFEEHGVDIVLAGHDHSYQRSYPLRAGRAIDGHMEPDFLDPGAPIYVVTGGGGAVLYSIFRSLRMASVAMRHHAVIFDIEGAELRMSAVDTAGVVFDSMSVRKTIPVDGGR
ncbi:MAG: metallophosphoesterase family protein [Planctomycetota bacterium]